MLPNKHENHVNQNKSSCIFIIMKKVKDKRREIS